MSGLPALPRRRVLAAGAAALGVVAAGGIFLALRPDDGQAGFAIGGPFTLTGSHGETVTDRDLRGRFALIYFGYTFCPDVCPTTLNTLATALGAMGPEANRITPVFITVDPQRDTPAVLRSYVAAFSPRLRGFTGTPAQIAAVEREYRVYAARHVTGPGPGDYTMDHTSLIYLMDPQGRFVTVIRADQTPAEMAADIQSHLTS